MSDWDALLLDAPHHDLRPPCPPERIRREEARLGPFPAPVREMLRRFNGGEFYVDAIAMVTLFGLSAPGDDPASDWYIDRFTPAWRSRGRRPGDLVVGMFNYGGVVVVDGDSVVREWDSAVGGWSTDHGPMRFGAWLSMVADLGQEYLADFP